MQEDIPFHLFRLKVIVPPQSSLLRRPDINRAEFLRNVIESAPTMRGGRRRVTWHVGNVEPISGDALYFRIGKTTKRGESQFDSASNRFLDEEIPVAPYSHALLYLPWQVCGISPNAKLAPTSEGVARQFQSLLNRSALTLDEGVSVEVAQINDPQELVQIIESSYQVQSFTFQFTRPNPIDVNRDFQLPLERFLEAANASKGRTTVSTSEDLDRGVVNEIARSAAAAGNEVSVKVRETPDTLLETRHLRDNPAQITASVEDLRARREAVQKLIHEYVAVRRGEGGG